MIYGCFCDYIQKDVKHFEELTVSQFGFKRIEVQHEKT